MDQKHFCSLLLGLSSEIGHLFHYHISVQKAVHSIGWNFTAYVPQKTKISFFPENWHPYLANDSWEIKKTLFFRLKILFANVSRLRKIFKNLGKDAIVFLEHFELQHVASIYFSLFFFKPRFQFWILHRYAYGKTHYKTRIYRFFHWFLEKKLGKQNVSYLTDSELLAECQRFVLNRAVEVVPIPHTQGLCSKEKKKQESLFLWWPGGSIREDKGLSVICHLASRLKGKSDIKLVLAEEARKCLDSSSEIQFIPTTLSRAEYLMWMEKTDFVFLPYSREEYSKRTSGIFVEAISLGTPPLVTKGTWMAYELEKFGLSRLTFDWTDWEWIERLNSLLLDPQIATSLAHMATYYRQFHSEKGFSVALQEIARKVPAK